MARLMRGKIFDRFASPTSVFVQPGSFYLMYPRSVRKSGRNLAQLVVINEINPRWPVNQNEKIKKKKRNWHHLLA